MTTNYIDATQFADALQQQCRALHDQRTDPHETPARQARAHVMEMTLQLVLEAVEACEGVGENVKLTMRAPGIYATYEKINAIPNPTSAQDGLVDVRGM